MAQFDLDGARNAGFSDDDIVTELATRVEFNLDGARGAGFNTNEILSELVERDIDANGGVIANVGQAFRNFGSGVVDAGAQFGSPEVLNELGLGEDPISSKTSPFQIVPGVAQAAANIGTGLVSGIPAAGLDFALSQSGEFDEDIALRDRDNALREEITALEKEASLIGNRQQFEQTTESIGANPLGLFGSSGAPKGVATNAQKAQQFTRLDEIQERLLAIPEEREAIRNTERVRKPSFDELREDFTFTPRESIGGAEIANAVTGAVGAVALPIISTLEETSDFLGKFGTDTEEEAEFRSQRIRGVLDLGLIAAAPAAVKGTKAVIGAGGRAVSSVARKTTGAIRDVRFNRTQGTRSFKIEKLNKEIAAENVAKEAVAENTTLTIRQKVQATRTADLKIDTLKTKRDSQIAEAEMAQAVQHAKQAGTVIPELAASIAYLENVATKSKSTGLRTIMRALLGVVKKNPARVLTGLAADGALVMAGAPIAPFTTGFAGGKVFNFTKKMLNSPEGIRDIWGNARAQAELEGFTAPAPFSEIASVLPKNVQADIAKIEGGVEVETIDIVDVGVEARKTPVERQAEQAELELDSAAAQRNRIAQERQATDRAEAQADAAADLQGRRTRQTPTQGNLALEEIILRRDLAAAEKTRGEVEASVRSKGPQSEMIDINDAINMASLRAAKKTATQADKTILTDLEEARSNGVTEVPRGSTGTGRKVASAAELKELEASQPVFPEEPLTNAEIAEAQKRLKDRLSRNRNIGGSGRTQPPKDTFSMVSKNEITTRVLRKREAEAEAEAPKISAETFRIKAKHSANGLLDEYVGVDVQKITIDELVNRVKNGETVERVMEDVSVTETLKIGKTSVDIGTDFFAAQKAQNVLEAALQDVARAEATRARSREHRASLDK